jgi:hypothetical protein
MRFAELGGRIGVNPVFSSWDATELQCPSQDNGGALEGCQGEVNFLLVLQPLRDGASVRDWVKPGNEYDLGLMRERRHVCMLSGRLTRQSEPWGPRTGLVPLTELSGLLMAR